MTASVRHSIRVVVFVGALLVALLFTERLAFADDATAQPAAPAPDPGGAAPPTDSTTTPPASVTPPALPPVVDPTPTTTPTSTPLPGGSVDPTVTPTIPAPTSDNHTPSGPSTPTNPNASGESTNQTANVVTGGTSVANTGANNAQAGAGSVPAEIALPTGGTGGGASNGTVTTGNAQGRGSVDENGIQQTVNAVVTQNGKVVVVQVAIIVNVGVGVAGSGNNAAIQAAVVSPAVSVAMVLARSEVAGAGPGTGPTPAQITSGNANATGNTGSTKVTQSLVLTGRDVTNQLASVLNIGVGVANTGLNFALAAVSSNNAGGPKSATFVTMGGSSSIAAGAAHALGNRSSSSIFQIVTVTASGNGNLLVIQRAIIVNFGLALANSGFNTAGGAAINAALPGASDAQQLLMLLLGQGSGSGPALLGAGGGGSATIGTGGARAVGNNTETGITQKVTGSVTGDDTARAIQDAWVGNFGVGVANSGGNGAEGLSGLDASSVAAARDALGAFLAGLTGVGDPVQGLDASFQLGSDLLQLQGNVSGTETLLGVGEPGTDPDAGASLTVRQVTAVLNIGIALGDSGHNTALVTSSGTGTTTTAGPGSDVAAASITTGDARAVGSHFAVSVCQAIGDAVTCAPPPPHHNPPPDNPPPENPPPGPPIETVGRIEVPPALPTPPAIGHPGNPPVLPFTGSPIGAELAAGSSLLIAGMLMARRRRTGAQAR